MHALSISESLHDYRGKISSINMANITKANTLPPGKHNVCTPAPPIFGDAEKISMSYSDNLLQGSDEWNDTENINLLQGEQVQQQLQQQQPLLSVVSNGATGRRRLDPSIAEFDGPDF